MHPVFARFLPRIAHAPRSIAALPLLSTLAFAIVCHTAAAQTASVPTQHNDNARTGANLLEKQLTPLNVTRYTFGKLFSIPLDANVNGQVLYMPNVTIGKKKHNVVYAYTSNNSNGSPCSLWAWDADTPSSSPLWHDTLPDSAEWTTCTPAIDPSIGTLYLVSKTESDSGATYLRAFDIATGAEEPGSPIEIAATVEGDGDGSSGDTVSFDTSHANCRPGVLIANNTIYIAFAHNSDSFPYHGWIFGYQYSPIAGAFTQTAVFCTTPNGGLGGVWQAGKGLAADDNGNIYCGTGNGVFDVNINGISASTDYGMCVLKLSPSLAVEDWFAPYDEASDSGSDMDLNNSGPLLIPETDRLFTGASKFGAAFLIDTTALGGFTPGGPDHVVARLNGLTPNYSVGQDPVCWDTGGMKYVYLWANGANLQQFQYDPSVNTFNPAGIYKSTTSMTSGAGLAVTANEGRNAILWAAAYNGVFRAFDANDVSAPELWDSQMDSSRDGLGSVGHFEFPTVVNGKAYVPTGSASIDVYGRLPHVAATADAYVRAGAYANTNYGNAGTLISDDLGRNAINANNRCIYLKFDLSKVATAPAHAYLALTQSSSTAVKTGSQNVALYSVADTTWTETGITYDNAPGLNQAKFTSTGTLIGTESVTPMPGQTVFDVTSFVSANLGKVVTLQLIDTSPQNVYVGFESRASGTEGPVIVLSS